MASSKKEVILDWLRDAHSMEQQAQELFETQADRIKNYPELQTRLKEHAKEGNAHQKLLKDHIERLGGSTSAVKDLGGKVMAWGQTASGLFVSDEVVKSLMSLYVFQHMAIASYRILIVAAKEDGDSQTESACEQIMKQEEAMAKWLYEQMPETTRTFLNREIADADSAKR